MASPDKKNTHRLSDLIYLALEDSISESDMAELDHLLVHERWARQYYLDFIENYCAVTQAACILSQDSQSDYDPQPLHEAIEQDLNKTAIHRVLHRKEIEKPCESEQVSQLRRKRLTWSQWQGILIRAAAVIALCAGALFLDRKLFESQYGPAVSVAEMTDAVDVRWQANGIDYRPGEKIYPGELSLENGWAKFLLYNGAEVIIQAPARFSLTSPDNMTLHYGRIYAKVPKEAIGFAVTTPNSKTIDLGTEFGLFADGQGNTDLHVFKGQTQLIANQAGHSKLVEHGNAQRVVARTSAMVDIELDHRQFACRIDGKNKKIWNGSNFIPGDVINVDFGNNEVVKSGWNTMGSTNGTLIDVVTSTGKTTTVVISLPVRFNGQNTNGTTDPTGDAQQFPWQATSDSFFGNDVDWSGLICPNARLSITELDPTLCYELTFSISRMNVTDNRQTQYVISGAETKAETLFLDPTNNTNTVIVSQAIAPTRSGTITVDIQKGPDNNNDHGFFYIGVLVIRALDESSPFAYIPETETPKFSQIIQKSQKSL